MSMHIFTYQLKKHNLITRISKFVVETFLPNEAAVNVRNTLLQRRHCYLGKSDMKSNEPAPSVKSLW